MAVTEFVSAPALKARCLNILNRLAPPELERVVKRTVARLTPPARHAEAVRNIHGFMRGSIIIAEGVDLTAPLLDPASTTEHDDWRG